MKKIDAILYKGLAFSLLLLLGSCGSKEPAKESAVDSLAMEIVTIPEKELGVSDVHLGKVEIRNMSAVVSANGILDVPPQSLVTLSAPMGGFVKMTEILQGMHVHKGQVLATLEHQDYIQLQQDYIDSKIQLEFAEQEYAREKELSNSNVSSLRNLQEITSKFKSLKNKVDALESKLYMIGVNAKDLKEGGIVRTIPVVSPIDGFITKVNVNVGKYVTSNDIMFEIVDTKHLHAEITIFEKDASSIQEGQKIKIVLANETKEREASVFLVSRSVDKDRTLNVHAHLEKNDPRLMPGLYVTAFIETGNKESIALPEEAFTRFGDNDYVFVQQAKQKGVYSFKMEPVIKSSTANGYTAFTFVNQAVKMDSPIVIKGSFDLMAKLKNSGEEE